METGTETETEIKAAASKSEPVIIRLEGDRVALECPLLPSAPPAFAETRRRRRRRRTNRGQQRPDTPVGVQFDQWPIDQREQRQQVSLPKIDETPARAAAYASASFRATGSPPLLQAPELQDPRAGSELQDEQPQRDRASDLLDGDDEDEAIELILWYRNAQSIYTVDARDHPQQLVSSAVLDPPQPAAAALAAGQSLVPVSPSAHLELEPEWQLNYGKGAANMNNRTTVSGSASGSGAQKASTRPQETAAKQQQQQRRLFGTLMDRRRTPPNKHYALASMSSRMRLSFANASAYLIIDNLRPTDSAQYKCRVDFRQARTRYQTSRLEVISK